MKLLKKIIMPVLLPCVFLAPGAWAAKPCDETRNAYGPFDYTNPEHVKNKLPVVEAHHFTPSVEALQHGKSGTLPGDMDYTLRAFPNHHRALYSMMRYQFENPYVLGTYYNDTQCYFQRGLVLKPDDAAIYQLWGMYHHHYKRYEDAIEKYEMSNKYNPDNPELLYNLGLVYFDMKKPEKSLEYAKKAYALGYPFPGLKMKLQRAGHWK